MRKVNFFFEFCHYYVYSFDFTVALESLSKFVKLGIYNSQGGGVE